MGLRLNPGKLIEDTVDEILRVVFEYYPEDHLSSFDHQQFRERIRYWLDNKLDIGEGRFDTAYNVGKEEGYSEGRAEATSDFRHKLQDIIDEL